MWNYRETQTDTHEYGSPEQTCLQNRTDGGELNAERRDVFLSGVSTAPAADPSCTGIQSEKEYVDL